MERGTLRIAVLTVALTALAIVIAGCGGGGSGGSSSTEASGEASAQFKATKANKQILNFGEEASDAEREAASSVLESNLRTREAADFASQCLTLNLKAIEAVVKPPKGKPSECAAALKKLAEPLKGTEEVRKDTLDGPITALRVKGKSGYALYHGNDGKDYAMSMEKEGGEWKVAALLTTEL